MLPSVHPAPKSDICRGSTGSGNSPGAGSGSGPVAFGLKRGFRVTGQTTSGRPPAIMKFSEITSNQSARAVPSHSRG